jgi:acyl-coenzyme A synthetase/AMP-(fatty) acid ligase
LRAHLASRMVGPKQPRVVVAVAELPHTDATGQIRRAQLRRMVLAEAGGDAPA